MTIAIGFGLTSIIQYKGSNPLDIPGIKLWLDADDASTITPGATDKVKTWRDKSGNGNDFEQTVEANQPGYLANGIGNKGSLSFNGTDQFIPRAFTSALNSDTTSIFIVCQVKGGAGTYRTPYSCRNNGTVSGYNIFAMDTNLWEFWVGNGTSWDGSLSGVDATTIEENSIIYSEITSSTAALTRKNNASGYDFAVSTFAKNTTESEVIGARDDSGTAPFYGNISEVIIFDRPLTTQERGEINAYLEAKWAFNPLQVSGCTAWWDMSDKDTILETSNKVSEITDKSGNDITMLQAMEVSQPTYVTDGINGLSALSFDGSNDFMETVSGNVPIVAGSASYTYYTVWKPLAETVMSVYEQSTQASVTGGRSALLSYGSTYGFNGEGNDYNVQAFSANDIIITGIKRVDQAANNIIIRHNSTTINTGTINNALNLGGYKASLGYKIISPGEYFNGYVGEQIVFNRDLTDAECEQVEKYLAEKWGLVPQTISDLQLWLDAADSSTITPGGTSDLVSVWADKSGNGNDAAQAVEVNQPSYITNAINGKNAVQFFSATNKYLVADLTASGNFTIFYVGYFTSDTNGSVFMQAYQTGQPAGNFSYSPQIAAITVDLATEGIAYYDDFIRGSSGVGTAAINTAFYGATIINSGSSILYYNGVRGIDGVGVGTPDYNHWAIGGRYYGGITGNNVVISEIIIIQRVISEAERLQVEKYLSNKWEP